MEPSAQTCQQENVRLKQQNQRLQQQNKELQQKVRLLEQKMTQIALNKSQSKEQVAPKKCNHNHDHAHDHGHNHSHHQHGHNHSHGHNPHNDQPQSEEDSTAQTPTAPPVPHPFLHKIYKTQEQINFRYFRLPTKTIKAWKKDQNVDLTKNKACMLHLREMKLNVSEFVQEVWQDVEWINLPECEIDDQGWKIIVQSASKAFPDLRVIGIRWNKITTIKEGQLQQFKNLRMIDLGLESDENNPLTAESRQVIKKFVEAHPNVKVD